MKLFLFLSFLIFLVAGELSFNCHFDEDEMKMTRARSGGNWHIYRWPGGKVPYYFAAGVTSGDKIFIQEQMKIIESKTCVTFTEYPSESESPEHHLEIRILHKSCMPQRNWYTFSASVTPYLWSKKVLFSSKNQFTDDSNCIGLPMFSGGVIHELFHALGAMHTHKRKDRDQYVKYDRSCLNSQTKHSQFKKDDFHFIEESKGIEYDLASIMHYECDTFSKCHGMTNCENDCPTLKPIDGTSCEAVGSNMPTETDWRMINQYQCGNNTPTACDYQDKYSNCENYKNLCWWHPVQQGCKATCYC